MLTQEMLVELIRGALVTVALTVCAGALAAVLALIAGVARLSKYWLVRTLAGVYIELFRGTSAIVQLFAAFYLLPFFGIYLDPFTAAAIVLGLNTGAYGAEVVRSGLQAVPKGQLEAAAALDLPRWARFRRVILPTASIIIVRPAGNILIDLIKATSLASLVGLIDLAGAAQNERALTGQTALIYAVLLVMYFILTSTAASGINVLDRRLRRGLHFPTKSRRRIGSPRPSSMPGHGSKQTSGTAGERP